MKKFLRRFSAAPPPSGHLEQVPTDQKYFGVSLDELLGEDLVPGEEQNASKDDEWKSVPNILKQFVDFLSSESALETEGIFRIAGSAKVVRELRAEVEKAGVFPTANIQPGDLPAVATLMKQWVREIKGGLIPPELTSAIYEDDEDVDADPNILFKEHLSSLPPSNLATFTYLLSYLHLLASHASVNKMTPHAIGVVFGPSIFRIAHDDEVNELDMHEQVEVSRRGAALVEKLVEGWGTIASDLRPEKKTSSANITKPPRVLETRPAPDLDWRYQPPSERNSRAELQNSQTMMSTPILRPVKSSSTPPPILITGPYVPTEINLDTEVSQADSLTSPSPSPTPHPGPSPSPTPSTTTTIKNFVSDTVGGLLFGRRGRSSSNAPTPTDANSKADDDSIKGRSRKDSISFMFNRRGRSSSDAPTPVESLAPDIEGADGKVGTQDSVGERTKRKESVSGFLFGRRGRSESNAPKPDVTTGSLSAKAISLGHSMEDNVEKEKGSKSSTLLRRFSQLRGEKKADTKPSVEPLEYTVQSPVDGHMEDLHDGEESTEPLSSAKVAQASMLDELKARLTLPRRHPNIHKGDESPVSPANLDIPTRGNEEGTEGASEDEESSISDHVPDATAAVISAAEPLSHASSTRSSSSSSLAAHNNTVAASPQHLAAATLSGTEPPASPIRRPFIPPETISAMQRPSVDGKEQVSGGNKLVLNHSRDNSSCSEADNKTNLNKKKSVSFGHVMHQAAYPEHDLEDEMGSSYDQSDSESLSTDLSAHGSGGRDGRGRHTVGMQGGHVGKRIEEEDFTETDASKTESSHGWSEDEFWEERENLGGGQMAVSGASETEIDREQEPMNKDNGKEEQSDWAETDGSKVNRHYVKLKDPDADVVGTSDKRSRQEGKAEKRSHHPRHASPSIIIPPRAEGKTEVKSVVLPSAAEYAATRQSAITFSSPTKQGEPPPKVVRPAGAHLTPKSPASPPPSHSAPLPPNGHRPPPAHRPPPPPAHRAPPPPTITTAPIPTAMTSHFPRTPITPPTAINFATTPLSKSSPDSPVREQVATDQPAVITSDGRITAAGRRRRRRMERTFTSSQHTQPSVMKETPAPTSHEQIHSSAPVAGGPIPKPLPLSLGPDRQALRQEGKELFLWLKDAKSRGLKKRDVEAAVKKYKVVRQLIKELDGGTADAETPLPMTPFTPATPFTPVTPLALSPPTPSSSPAALSLKTASTLIRELESVDSRPSPEALSGEALRTERQQLRHVLTLIKQRVSKGDAISRQERSTLQSLYKRYCNVKNQLSQGKELNQEMSLTEQSIASPSTPTPMTPHVPPVGHKYEKLKAEKKRLQKVLFDIQNGIQHAGVDVGATHARYK
ncbi:Protein fam13c, partial [Rhizophlyctis rosea]